MLVVLVAVVAVLLVLVRGGRDAGGSDGDTVADVAGTSAAPRGDLPPVVVDTPDVTPAADLACPVLMGQLPLELAGETSRLVVARVQSVDGITRTLTCPVVNL